MTVRFELIDKVRLEQLTTEYKMLSDLERSKSQNYSNIFMVAVTIFIALMALFSDNPQVNSKYFLAIPITLLLWFSFVMYNALYLRIVREDLCKLEKKIYETDNEYFRKNASRWHSDRYPKAISGGLARPLFIANILVFIVILAVSFYFSYGGIRQIFCEYRTSYVLYSDLEHDAKNAATKNHAQAKEQYEKIERQVPVINFIYIVIVIVLGVFIFIGNRRSFKRRTGLDFIWW